jgi:hypothetical protein
MVVQSSSFPNSAGTKQCFLSTFISFYFALLVQNSKSLSLISPISERLNGQQIDNLPSVLLLGEYNF